MRKVINLNRKWAFTMDASQVPQTLPTPSYFVNLPHSLLSYFLCLQLTFTSYVLRGHHHSIGG